MNALWDLAVIGGGVFGTSLAALAAATGKSVGLIEQFTIGSPRATSHGSRNLSVPWVKPGQIEATKFSIEFWQGVSRGNALQSTRQLEVNRPGTAVEQTVQQLQAHGASYRLLTSSGLTTVTPHLRFGEGAEGLLVEGHGWVASNNLLTLLAEHAAQLGAAIHEHTETTEIHPQGDYVRVHTKRGVFVAKHLVVAAGPWATRSLVQHAGLAMPLTTTQEQAIYFRGASGPQFAPCEFPFVEDASRTAPGYYIIPDVDGQGIKIGATGLGPTFEFDGSPLVADPKRTEAVIAYAQATLMLDTTEQTLQPCAYTVLAPKYQVQVTRSSTMHNVLAILGCSGSGFKLGPAAAEVALAAIDDRTPRFAGGESFVS